MQCNFWMCGIRHLYNQPQKVTFLNLVWVEIGWYRIRAMIKMYLSIEAFLPANTPARPHYGPLLAMSIDMEMVKLVDPREN